MTSSTAVTSEVVWYVTGRFYGKSGSTALQDVGYFLHLQGVEAPLFAGERSEGAAFFTFSSDPFATRDVSNGPLDVGLDKRGQFRLYLRERPGATFDDPASFAEGRCIATFARVAVVSTAKVPEGSIALLSNVFTARLVGCEPFDFGGVRYDPRELFGDGITQWGIAATDPVAPPAGYDAVVPFVGSAIRIG